MSNYVTTFATINIFRYPVMPAVYDVFLSHAWADGDRPQQIAAALGRAGLRVWFDADEIGDFASITRAVTEGLAQSKALVAYYSKTYPLRRACQWELTTAFLAAQNEEDPRRRVVIINPEKSINHIHPIELRDAKFRTAPANQSEVQELAQSLARHVTTLDGSLADIRPLFAPNWYGTSPIGSTRFVGRLPEMWQIHSLLHAGDVTQITGAAVASGGIGQVSGLGGVGKSLLAEEYALHFGAAYPGGVFWLRAHGNDDAKSALGSEQREALCIQHLQALAHRLGIDTHDVTTERMEGALAREIEQRGQPCLWIVDDVPNGLSIDQLRSWFAPHPLARTLITTRSREYASLAKGLDLGVLEPEEAYELLTSRTKPRGDTEKAQALELATDLGYHALAVEVAASALVSYDKDEPYRQFREELLAREEDTLELAKDLAEALPGGHSASIAQTLLVSIRKLGPAGQDFLRLPSVLAVAPIPAWLVTGVLQQTHGLEHSRAEQLQRKAFHEVTTTSLAELSGEQQDARSVHTLVSRTVRFHGQPASPLGRVLRRLLKPRTDVLRKTAISILFDHLLKGKNVQDGMSHFTELVLRGLEADYVLQTLRDLDPRDSVLSQMYWLQYMKTGKLHAFNYDLLRHLFKLSKRGS
jgi:hypothetical protein